MTFCYSCKFRVLLIASLLAWLGSANSEPVFSSIASRNDSGYIRYQTEVLLPLPQVAHLPFSLVYQFSYTNDIDDLTVFGPAYSYSSHMQMSGNNELKYSTFSLLSPTRYKRYMDDMGFNRGVNIKFGDRARLRLYGNRLKGTYIAPKALCLEFCEFQFISSFELNGSLLFLLRAWY